MSLDFGWLATLMDFNICRLRAVNFELQIGIRCSSYNASKILISRNFSNSVFGTIVLLSKLAK